MTDPHEALALCLAALSAMLAELGQQYGTSNALAALLCAGNLGLDGLEHSDRQQEILELAAGLYKRTHEPSMVAEA